MLLKFWREKANIIGILGCILAGYMIFDKYLNSRNRFNQYSPYGMQPMYDQYGRLINPSASMMFNPMMQQQQMNGMNPNINPLTGLPNAPNQQPNQPAMVDQFGNPIFNKPTNSLPEANTPAHQPAKKPEIGPNDHLQKNMFQNSNNFTHFSMDIDGVQVADKSSKFDNFQSQFHEQENQHNSFGNSRHHDLHSTPGQETDSYGHSLGQHGGAHGHHGQ